MRVLDLFAGAVGGWSHGMHRAGYRTAAACEIDSWRRAVFAAQFPGTVMYADVRDLTATRLLDDLGYLPDVIVGSPPCQDISSANTKGKGVDGARSGLFFEAVRLVGECRPLWGCLENSPLVRIRGYDRIAEALEAHGYACWPVVVGADDVGANHRRKRAWIVFADADGHIAMGAGSDDGTARDADDDAIMPGQGLRARPNTDAAGNDLSRHSADADGARGRQPTLPHGPPADHRPSPDTDRPRHQIGPGERCDPCPELPPALRAIGESRPDWNGGFASLTAACAAAGAGVVDDGSIYRLPPGLRNRAIAALGDAVVSKIPEAIGRAMKVIAT